MTAVVVITGGRDFKPSAAWDRALVSAFREHDPATVFEGEARGADQWAGRVARRERLTVHAVPALWGAEGRGAGPRRNARMLLWAVMLGADLGLPVVVIALPGGVGTGHMKGLARGRGLRVIELSEASS